MICSSMFSMEKVIFSDDDDSNLEPDNVPTEPDVDTNGEDVVAHNEPGYGVIFDTLVPFIFAHD